MTLLVIDQDIDTREMREARGDCTRNRRRIRQHELPGPRFAALSFNGFDDSPGGCPALPVRQMRDKDARACGRQRKGDAFADSPARACYDRNPACKI